MTRMTFIAAAGALLLAGCSGGGEEAQQKGGVSVKEAAQTAKDAIPRPQPGLYKTTVTLTGFDIPGLPENMKGHGAGVTHTSENCLSEAAVAKGYEELVKEGQDGDCTFERFDAKSGTIDAVLVCKAAGTEKRIALSGTSTGTGATLDGSVAIDLEGGGSGTMNFTTTHERIGDCPAPKPAK